MCPAQFSFLSRQYPIIFCDPMKEAGFGGKTSHPFDESQLRIRSPFSKPPTKPLARNLFRKKRV